LTPTLLAERRSASAGLHSSPIGLQKLDNYLRKSSGTWPGLASDRFVKKKHWEGVADRQEGGGAAGTNICNNTGVRIDPPRSSNRRRLGGSKQSLGGLNPPPNPPANRTLGLATLSSEELRKRNENGTQSLTWGWRRSSAPVPAELPPRAASHRRRRRRLSQHSSPASVAMTNSRRSAGSWSKPPPQRQTSVEPHRRQAQEHCRSRAPMPCKLFRVQQFSTQP